MSALRRNLMASVADRYASQLIAVATLAVMSRILTPAEVGVYILANLVILLADNLRMFGVGIYVVQEPGLDRVKIRAASTVTFAISFALAAMINLSSGAVSQFFREPEIAHLFSIASIGFCVMPFGSTLISMMQRELAFVTLAWLNVTASAVNSAVTIGLGVAGFGPASYIWGFVASSLALALLAVWFRRDFWVFRPSLVGARRILSFGVVSSAVTVANMAYDMLPRLVLGRTLGADAVGVFGRAVTICQLPERAITMAMQPVILPALAAQLRAGEDLKASYLRGITLMTAVQWPALALLALLAHPVVFILLGDQWDQTAPIVQMVALSSMLLAPGFLTFPVLVAVGRIRDTLLSSLICLPPSIAVIILASSMGLMQVAASMFVLAPMQMFVALGFVKRAINFSWTELFSAMTRSAVLTVGSAIPPALVILLSSNGFSLTLGEAILGVTVGGLGWLTALIATNHPLKVEIFAVWRIISSALERFSIRLDHIRGR